MLEGTADAESLRLRFDLLTNAEDRRAFLREVHSNRRLLELWKANGKPSPAPADPFEQAEGFVYDPVTGLNYETASERVERNARDEYRAQRGVTY